MTRTLDDAPVSLYRENDCTVIQLHGGLDFESWRPFHQALVDARRYHQPIAVDMGGCGHVAPAGLGLTALLGMARMAVERFEDSQIHFRNCPDAVAHALADAGVCNLCRHHARRPCAPCSALAS